MQKFSFKFDPAECDKFNVDGVSWSDQKNKNIQDKLRPEKIFSDFFN